MNASCAANTTAFDGVNQKMQEHVAYVQTYQRSADDITASLQQQALVQQDDAQQIIAKGEH